VLEAALAVVFFAAGFLAAGFFAAGFFAAGFFAAGFFFAVAAFAMFSPFHVRSAGRNSSGHRFSRKSGGTPADRVYAKNEGRPEPSL